MKKSLLFVNDEMTMGGVARILNDLLSRLDPELFEIDVLILHPHGELLNDLPKHVRRLESTPFFKGIDVSLNEAIKHFNIIAIYNKLRVLAYMKSGLIGQKIRQERARMKLKLYDVEFSAKEGFCTIFVAEGNSKRKLNWVQVDYSQQNYSKNHMPLMIKSLQKIDQNIACSVDVQKAYSSIFQTPRVRVIHNFIDDQKIIEMAQEPCDVKMNKDSLNLITVARFHPQKSVDRLIDAFHSLKQSNPHTTLYIIGDGDLKEALVQQVKTLNLEDSIVFLGLKKNPYPYIKQADCFVLSSKYEGYPTIVIESLLSGTPVLATHVSGVKEQIEEGKSGWVVDNSTEELASKLLDFSHDANQLTSAKKYLTSYRYPNDEILSSLIDEISR